MKYSTGLKVLPVVVACACDSAACKGKFRNGVDSKPAGGNSPSIDGRNE